MREINADLLLVDDSKARQYAKEHNLEFMGTGGDLISAKNQRLITLVRPLLDQLISKEYYIDNATYLQICAIAGE